jgi:hypothetical protein
LQTFTKPDKNMNVMKPTPTLSASTDISQWFDNFVASIRAEELQLVSGIAIQEKKDFWKPLLENNTLEIAARTREAGSMLIIPELVTDYINGFKLRDIKLFSLSLQLSDSNILVWAVVNDDDEATMDQLFLLEAEVNAKYSDYGLHISTTIMEKSDNCAIPSQFQPVI